MASLRLIINDLQCRNRSLKRELDSFRSGARYTKLQEDYRRVCDGYVREISRLRGELAKAEAATRRHRAEVGGIVREYEAEIARNDCEIRSMNERLWETVRKCDERLDAAELRHREELAEKDAIIKELSLKVSHCEALLGHDGTNTGIPTSQTPPNKKKLIPNSRGKSGRKKGGQPGHERHVLDRPDDSEVTDVIPHRPTEEGYVCPRCDCEHAVATGETEERYEYDVEIVVHKKKHVFFAYRCSECGQEFFSKHPPGLRGDVQYGSGVRALILSLTNTVNAAMNKTAMFLYGITGGALSPCEGYVAKLQAQAGKALRKFREDLKMELIKRSVVYWDDTVIMVMTARACLRFYGDETIALYTAHAHKDMEGLDDDNVLNLMTSDTTVMHDHNTVNYNEKYGFENIECNQHLQRDCQRNSDDTQHEWSGELKELIGNTIKDRKDAISRGVKAFSEAYIRAFNKSLDDCLSKGWRENAKAPDAYGAKWEVTLLNRIEKYRLQYFRWVEDFSLPTTNNVSERGLRGAKSHMKISGQFESVDAADDYATIRTYTETCRRNKINEIIALRRLFDGNPYTVAEVFSG